MSLPPLHPALVHFPIAFILLSVGADCCARASKREPRRAAYRAVGFSSLLAGLVAGALTIAAGYWDMDRAALEPDTFGYVVLHRAMGWALAGCLAILAAWRWLIRHRGQMTINTSYLAAACVVLGLTLFQGWFGGEMVYSYGAGVAVDGQGTEAVAPAKSRLAAIRNLLQPRPAAMGGAESPGGTNVTGGAKGP